jgi:hypothetical protein
LRPLHVQHHGQDVDRTHPQNLRQDEKR